MRKKIQFFSYISIICVILCACVSNEYIHTSGVYTVSEKYEIEESLFVKVQSGDGMSFDLQVERNVWNLIEESQEYAIDFIHDDQNNGDLEIIKKID